MTAGGADPPQQADLAAALVAVVEELRVVAVVGPVHDPFLRLLAGIVTPLLVGMVLDQHVR
jgi:hypothetical protein